MEVLNKNELQGLLKRFRGPVEIDESLINCLNGIWKTLAADQCSNVDIWLLSARAAICGLYYISGSTDNFYEQFVTFWRRVVLTENTVCIPFLRINVKFKSDMSFRAACSLGFMHLVTSRNILYPKEKMNFLFTYVIFGCTEYSRFNKAFIYMLYEYVKCYKSKVDVDIVFKIALYNLEHKESMLILQEIIPHSAESIFKTLIECVPWLYKHKYILLNAIMKYDHKYVARIPHKEFARALVCAQGCANLAAASSKLYCIVIKNIEENTWINNYYPIIKNSIIEPVNVTISHRNIFKLLMKDTLKQFNDLFDFVLLDLQAVKPYPIDAIMNLAVLGYDLNLLDSDADLSTLIEKGKTSPSAHVRYLGLNLMIKYVKGNVMYLDKIQHCLMFNINDADKTGRDYILKCCDQLFKHIYDEVQKRQKNDQIIIKFAEFLEWIIKFLFNQLNIECNYRRLSLTIALISHLHNIFQQDISDPNAADKMTAFLNRVNSYNKESYVEHIFDLLTFATDDNKRQVFQLILNVIPTELMERRKQQLWSLGLKHIKNVDLDTKQIGERFLQMYVEFAVKVNDNQFEKKVDILINMANYQWNTIKNSDKVSIIADGNSLHPVLNMLCYIHKLNIFDLEKHTPIIMNLAEDMVANLLPIFHSRAMVDSEQQFCKGVAEAFKDRSSQYHRLTVNCMWITLKEMCNLISIIGATTPYEEFVKLALHIHHRIIQHSFHKGAIESAGAGIGEIISALTQRKKMAHIADTYLEEVLLELPRITTSNSTVRRSAEVRVVLSNISLNDKRYTKPLYHRTMGVIRRILQRQVGNNYKSETVTLMLHCLEPLITDTRVEIHILDYIGDLLLVFVGFLGRQNWDVKNAINIAFGALTNRIFKGAAANIDNKYKYSTVCIEEILFHIGYDLSNAFKIAVLEKIDEESVEKLEDILKPVLCFYGTSFSRGDEWSIDIKQSKLERKSIVFQYLYTCTEFDKFLVGARTYTALCSHDELIHEIQVFRKRLFTLKWPLFFSIALIKLLADKLLQDEMYLPGSTDIQKQVFLELDLVVKQIYQKGDLTSTYMVSCLYNKNLTNIQLIKMKANFIIATSPNSRVPRFFYHETLHDFIMHEKYIDVFHVFEYYLTHNINLSNKILMLNLMLLRLKKLNEFTLFQSKGLDCFLNFLQQFNFSENLQLALVICRIGELLDHSNMSNTLKAKLFTIFNKIKHQNIAPCYYAAFLALAPAQANSDSNDALLHYIIWKNIFNCFWAISEEEPNIVLLRSILFLRKFKLDTVLCVCISLAMSMLQTGSEEMFNIVQIFVARVFNCEPTHPYECLHIIINKVNTILSPLLSFKCLFLIFYPANQFEKHFAFASLFILEDLVTDNLIKNFYLMTREQQQKYFSWLRGIPNTKTKAVQLPEV